MSQMSNDVSMSTEAMDVDGADASLASAVSAASDIEFRVHHLAEELRSKRAEVARLKDENKQKRHERLLAKEASLLKQVEVNLAYTLGISC